MAYASRAGRAIANSSDPQAFGVCDRCGIWENFRNLSWQYDYSGSGLINKYLLFCPQCLDVPQPQLLTIILPPDPLPIQYARFEPFAQDEAGPTQSQLAQYAQQGASTLFLQSVDGFTTDQSVKVQMNNGNFAQVEILSIDSGANSINISIPLPYSATPPNIVTA